MAYYDSEWLKYRRTLTPWLVVCGPLAFALAQMVFNMISPLENTWEHILMNVHNWWAIIGFPFGVVLLTALAVFYERRSGALKVLNAYPLQPGMQYAAKFAVTSVHVLIASLIFVVLVFGLNFWAASGSVPWDSLLTGFLCAWLAGLAQIAIMLWIAHGFGFGWTVIIGLIGTVSGIVMSEQPYWIMNPWSWPIRSLIPLFKFHTNGLPLEADSPLQDPSLILIPIVLGIVSAGIVTGFGMLWYNRREVR
ncbi:lantibiotic immunity ABC transporter MutE/EpiE family permease subunit [Paenibacillus tyrfis]|uniref:lantibiotic immunity ABC transporter MutE/EpiE family permease subunit n=1 Tax=Paenibacillus tyrfis TaxID=1501230 RepID=UPI00209E620C|nr:lantibiotic immunity ABC transporter MutE/EpiE family permease subunit [Paenibacillus tyrfis]MCP1308116.1 lantibiotic immunity ABC transporter MutE/EpiE family permease subunit [Paenibacillus tyrfis]